MNRKKGLIITCLLAFSMVAAAQSEKSLAVVELFTSEGCSSCPAADELLREMAEQRENDGKPFIALAFHVTYWNHLGWADPFSNEVYTNRQKQYAATLNQPQFYTPQAVVNGMYEFIGSDARAFRDTLAKAERKRPVFFIEGRARQLGDSIEVTYTLNKDSKNYWMCLAILEKNSERIVTRGENKNRTLTHFNTVREFKILEAKRQDVLMFGKVKDLSINNMEIVLYVQHKKTMRIVGASKISISE